MLGFETQDWWFLLLVAALALAPGVWLYRDARRLGKNPWPWVGAYAIAVFIPRFRFVCMALVFVTWLVVRDRDFRVWRKSKWFNRLARLFSRR